MDMIFKNENMIIEGAEQGLGERAGGPQGGEGGGESSPKVWYKSKLTSLRLDMKWRRRGPNAL